MSPGAAFTESDIRPDALMADQAERLAVDIQRLLARDGGAEHGQVVRLRGVTGTGPRGRSGIGRVAENERNGGTGSRGGKHTTPRDTCGKGHQEPFEGERAQHLVGAHEAP